MADEQDYCAGTRGCRLIDNYSGSLKGVDCASARGFVARWAAGIIIMIAANGTYYRPFHALFAVAKAIEARSPEDLEAALIAVPQVALLRVASRHRCLGYLYHALSESVLASERVSALKSAVRAYANKAAFQSHFVRAQLDDLIQAFTGASLPFVLLKGAARMTSSDRDADRNTMFDLDILVPQESAAQAAGVLQARGYRTNALDLPEHHHLAPLHPPHPGLPIELHLALTPPGWFSIESDWKACEPYFEQTTYNGIQVTRLNHLGSALHLILHGAATTIRRLHDAILLAQLFRDDKKLQEQISAVIQQEVRGRTALMAMFTLSARIAGTPTTPIREVDRFLDWVFKREDLTDYVRTHCQFADAWYANGGSVVGPATRRAFPRELEPNQMWPVFAGQFLFHSVGRMITSAYAIAAAARLAQIPT